MKKILLLCLFGVLIFTGCNKKEENLPPVNNEENNVQIFEEQTVGQAILKDHNVAYYDNISHVSLTIYNENSIEISIPNIRINYYKKDILVYETVETVGVINANNSYNISIITDINLANCDKVTYEIIN